MNIWEGVSLAAAQIRSQKLKSFFSVLGVIIGVMFLIVVVSVVEGMDQYVKEDLASEIFGVNTVTIDRAVTSMGNRTAAERRAIRRRPYLTAADAEAVRARLQTPGIVSLQVDNRTTLSTLHGRAVENVEAIAAEETIFEIRGWTVERGRAFTAQESAAGSAVVVLGNDVADALYPDEDPLGQRVRAGGQSFRIVGILEPLGSLFGQSRDSKIIGPFNSALGRVTSYRGFVDEIIVQTPTPDLVPAARLEVEGIMRSARRLRPREANDFSVETVEESLSFWDRISRILFIAFPTLVAISLIVGGIVIMNIMLVSVMERTREIGVRKALGARRRDILTQVLIESSTLSLMGALVGVGIGAALAWIVRAATPLPAEVALRWVMLAMILGVGTGIAAGVYPASRASKLDPVDALRYE